MKKIIENVELIEIRKEDGAQHYKWGDGITDSLWLMGWTRASNVKVGDRGRLVYKTGPNYGAHFFEKKEEK